MGHTDKSLMNKSFELILLVSFMLISACQKMHLNANLSKITAQSINPPAAPVISIASVPLDSSKSPTFSLSSVGASEFQMKILRTSDDSVMQDWTAVTPGSSLTGLSLDDSTSYYAVFRAVNAAGMSGEVSSESWIPNSEDCTGAMLTSLTYAGGDGSIASPFLICTTDQLLHLASDLANFKKYFKLLSNIDLQGVSFDGIGSDVNPFQGVFNGNNKIIRGMTILRVSGDNVGFFNYAKNAIINNLTFEDPSVTATSSDYAGAFSGYCMSSSYQNISLVNSSVQARKYVGLVAGSGDGCIMRDIVLSGTIVSLSEYGGGVLGIANYSSILNVVATVDVNSPAANYIGGALGGVSSSTTRMQNMHVTGTVVGANRVGGLVGADGDGLYLYRSSFNGSVEGIQDVGGIIGRADDSPTKIASVSSQFTIEGNKNVGGIVGLQYDSQDSENVYVTGTITAVGASPQNFGGMMGLLAYDSGSIKNSLAVVSIHGSASRVGGMVGGEYSGGSPTTGLQHTNNALIVDVTGSDAFNSVSLFSGWVYMNALHGTSYYWSGGLCDNTGAGNCNAMEGTAIPGITTFYSNVGVPMSTWDFTNVWKLNAGTFPELLQDQVHTPAATFTCHNQLLAGYNAICSLTSTDLDPHEFTVPAFASDHTCRWLHLDYSKTNILTGGSDAEVGTCNLSFTLTDGKFSSNAIQMTFQVFDDLTILPRPAVYDNYYDIGAQAVSGGSRAVALTITNNKSFPITGFSVTGFDEGSYTLSGGTCGATLAASASCSVTISYDPASTGFHNETLNFNFTHSSGPVVIEYGIKGSAF